MREKIMLGDIVEKVIHAITPNKVLEKVEEKEGGCGCSKRKEILNRI